MGVLISYYHLKVVDQSVSHPRVIDMTAWLDERKFPADKKRRFHIACMRVTDNARDGYVVEGDKVYYLSRPSRTAQIVTGEQRDKVLAEIQALTTGLVMEKLKCETDTPEMARRIKRAFTTKLGKVDKIQIDFEHGQWWVTRIVTGAQWSVVDAEGPGSIDGFDFEQVSGGDES